MAHIAPKLLIVEDEVKVARFLSQGLREEGYEVDVAHTHAQAQALLDTPSPTYELLLLDWMLPDGDGLSLAQAARDRGEQMPVLMLTARDTVHERVEALNAGADDYLVKPFAFAELVARVRALLRRSRNQLSVVRVPSCDVEIDLINRTVKRGGQAIPLTTKEFSVLAYLARHQGRAVSRSELLKQVWSDTSEPGVTANVVDVQIARLRDKLETTAGPQLIQTVRKVGYALGDRPLEQRSVDPAVAGSAK